MYLAFWWFYLVLGSVLTVLTLPLLSELLLLSSASLLPRRSLRRNHETPARPVRLTVVVPAHNEETLIERCVRSLAASQPANVEILVLAHNCSDQTALRAKAAGATVLVLEDLLQKGKASALRAGFAHAISRGAEALVVVDADSVVSAAFLAEVQQALSANAAVVQATYKVLPQQGVDRTSLTSIAFQGFNIVRPRGRERLGLSAGIFGNGFGLRKEVLESVPYRADSVVEDLEYHVQLVMAKQRVRFLEDVAVFGEMPQAETGSASQRARWEGGRLLMMRRLPLRLIAAIGRGEVRLFEPLLDVLSIPLAMGVMCLLLLAISPVGWMRWYAAAGLATIAFHFLLALKAGPSFWKGLRVLLRVPGYVFWKIVLTPKILLASRSDAAWVRTQREEPEFSGHSSADAIE